MTPQTPRPVDFPSATIRHLNDANLLESNGRFVNAGHLYGIGAECGVKALLVAFNVQVDPEGSPAKATSFKVHVNTFSTIVTELHSFLSSNGRAGAHFLAMIPSITAFSDWDVSHRYYSETAIPQSISNWKSAAQEVGHMLDQLRSDGLI